MLLYRWNATVALKVYSSKAANMHTDTDTKPDTAMAREAFRFIQIDINERKCTMN